MKADCDDAGGDDDAPKAPAKIEREASDPDQSVGERNCGQVIARIERAGAKCLRVGVDRNGRAGIVDNVDQNGIRVAACFNESSVNTPSK